MTEDLRIDGLADLFAQPLPTRFGSSGSGMRLMFSDPDALDVLYEGSHYARRIIDTPARDATRRWCRVYVSDVQGDASDAAEPFADDFRRLGLRFACEEAWRLADLYGGAAIVLDVDDGMEPDQPIASGRVRAIRSLRVVDRYELQPIRWFGADAGARVGDPSVYRLTPHGSASILGADGSVLGVHVHADRVIRLIGCPISRRRRDLYEGWGQSRLDVCSDEILRCHKAEGDISRILDEFNVAIAKIRGLRDMAVSNNRELLHRRLDALAASKAAVHLIALDAEGEDYAQRGGTVTGIADIFSHVHVPALAAAAEMPITLLFGTTPKGLSTDDQAGRRNYFDAVGSRQVSRLEPVVDRVVDLLRSAAEGPDVAPDAQVRVEWVPLEELTESAAAEVRSKQAQVDRTYWEMGVLGEREIRASRFGGAGYSTDTRLLDGEEPAAPDTEET